MVFQDCVRMKEVSTSSATSDPFSSRRTEMVGGTENIESYTSDLINGCNFLNLFSTYLHAIAMYNYYSVNKI